MKNRFLFGGPVISLLLGLACSLTMGQSAQASLPHEVVMNQMAGRGGDLIVTLRLKNGQKLPFLVDTGASGTMIDKSLVPKLGKPLGTVVSGHWGVKSTNKVYRAPKLYLGGVPLKMTGRGIVAYDFKSDSTASGRRIMGLLGIDVLRHYCIQLNFAARTMRFLDAARADKHAWGRAFPIVALDSHDSRPAVAYNLLGQHGPHSLIDSGFQSDGWLMPKHFVQWTNETVTPAKGEARSPNGIFDGQEYRFLSLAEMHVGHDGIGLSFLARNLVTLDFPDRTLYLKRQTIFPLPDPRLKTTPMPALAPLVHAVLEDNVHAAREELAKIEQGRATRLQKRVARNLETTLEDKPKPSPADVPLSVTRMPLGDCRPEVAKVGWLKPAENRIPPNGQILSPLLDSGRIYATGLFAHAPSRYVFNLNGKWKTLRGEAGLHTAFQHYAYGVIFVIKADGREVFRSGVIRGASHPRYNVNVRGVKTLELVVKKAAVRNGGDWGLWLDPTLFR